MGAGIQLPGLRKDGSTFPVRVSLTPVTTASGQLTLAIIRDITGTGRLDDLAGMAWDAAEAQRGHLQLLDAVIDGLFYAGLGGRGLPGTVGEHDLRAGAVVHGGARGAQRRLAGPVVVAAQQQVHRVTAGSGRRHDHRDHRDRRAATGTAGHRNRLARQLVVCHAGGRGTASRKPALHSTSVATPHTQRTDA